MMKMINLTIIYRKATSANDEEHTDGFQKKQVKYEEKNCPCGGPAWLFFYLNS